MRILKEKARADSEAMKKIKKIRSKVQEINRLFLRSRNSGSSQAAKIGTKAALSYSDHSLLLTESMDTGRKMIRGKDIDQRKVKIVSWESAIPQKVRGVEGPLIVDNSFMLRAMDAIVSTLTFLIAEVEKLKKENKNLKKKLNKTK